MINLLPPEQKQSLFLEQTRKLVIVLGSMAIISLLCLILVLLSVRLYAESEAFAQKTIFSSQESNFKTADASALKEKIQRYNSTISVVDSFYSNQATIANALKTVTQIEKPSALYFKNLSLVSNLAQKNVEVVLTGFSNNRDSLLVFKKNLELEKSVKEIIFSPESWISAEDVDFYVTFKVSQ